VDYQRIHDQIIEKRRTEKPTGYTEKHHIIPSSFGGTDDPSNLIELTAREHFLCHYLLVRIHSKERGLKFYKAVHAFMMMRCSSEAHGNNRITSRLFEKYKKEHSEIMRKTQIGENNSQFGKMWVSYIELEMSKKIDKELYPLYYEQGWIQGRKTWKNLKTIKPKVSKSWISYVDLNLITLIDKNLYPLYYDQGWMKGKITSVILRNRINKETEKCNSIDVRLQNKKTQVSEREKYAKELWEKFKKGNYKSMRHFASLHYDKSVMSLTNLWKTHIQEYRKYVSRGKATKTR
jgi:hypothetical protein